MRRTLSVLGASLLFCLATAGTAAALDPPSSGPTFGQTQSSSQNQTGSNSVSQTASSEAISAPGAQVNINLPISLLSDGKSGPVEQSNDSSATSSASNDSKAIQGIDQSQGSGQTQDGSQQSGCCNGSSPSFDQGQDSTQSQNASNSVGQNASSKAVSAPGAQINVNAPIRIASDGDNGPVTQSNSSSADSSASNTSFAKQGVEQEQSSTQEQDGTQKAGCGCKGGSDPTFGQSQGSDQTQTGSNSVSQNAESKAVSAPGAQINVNAPIRILSDGDNGKVDQSNSSSATSSASNESKAIQFVDQDQASSQAQNGKQSTASGDNGHEGYQGPKGKSCGCEHGSGPTFDQTQDSSQNQSGSNSVTQNADSKAISKPGLQANLNVPIRIKSEGSNGPVDQSNSSSATSSASNESKAIQLIDQGQESTQTQDGVQKVGCCDHGKGGHYGPKGKENGCGCGEHGSGPVFNQDQTSDQSQDASNSVTQNAESKAISKPGKQVNLNAPLRFGGHPCGCEPSKQKGKGKVDGSDRSCGCGHAYGKKGPGAGPVDQSNTSAADSSASNTSWAAQGVGQSQVSGQLQQGLQRL